MITLALLDILRLEQTIGFVSSHKRLRLSQFKTAMSRFQKEPPSLASADCHSQQNKKFWFKFYDMALRFSQMQLSPPNY
jgi:hypothetical protein